MVRYKPQPTQSAPIGVRESWHGTLYLRFQAATDATDELASPNDELQPIEHGEARNTSPSMSAEKKMTLWVRNNRLRGFRKGRAVAACKALNF